MKTVVPKMSEIQGKWYVVDAHNQILGRLASQVAHVLRGKHRPDFTPHLDLGDHVVIVNAEKIRVSGKKFAQKFYTRYTGYPGGLRIQLYKNLLHDRPERILYHAVKGMLPKNRLGRKMIRKLRIYKGPSHPHQAQKIEALPNGLRKKKA